MKVLILSCSTGGGHNSCASYREEELKANNIEFEFKDFFDIVNPKGKELSSKLYLACLKGNGKIFKGVYSLGEAYSNTGITSPVYLVNKLHKHSLLNYIKENKFTLVITTHLFPALTLTAINKTEKPSINFITIATDYEPCPFMEESKPNMLIIQKGLEGEIIKYLQQRAKSQAEDESDPLKGQRDNMSYSNAINKAAEAYIQRYR